MTVVLIGCGRRKQSRPAPAGELYTGSVFSAARAYALASGAPWAIVSAAHGMVLPTTWLRPYDHEMAAVEDLERWAVLVGGRVERWWAAEDDPVVLLMGHRYGDPIAAELDRRGIASSQPLRRLGTGRRIAWLLGEANRMRAEARGKKEGEMTNGRALDPETVKWIRSEAEEDGDAAIVRACDGALVGDLGASLTVEETLRARVARAHRAHCQRGQASRLSF